eukprot:1536376-Pyramimonas_sp.AAC.1
MDVLANSSGGRGCDEIVAWMRGQPRDCVTWLLLRIANVTDNSGAEKARLQLTCTCDDEDVPALWIIIANGR